MILLLINNNNISINYNWNKMNILDFVEDKIVILTNKKLMSTS